MVVPMLSVSWPDPVDVNAIATNRGSIGICVGHQRIQHPPPPPRAREGINGLTPTQRRHPPRLHQRDAHIAWVGPVPPWPTTKSTLKMPTGSVVVLAAGNLSPWPLLDVVGVAPVGVQHLVSWSALRRYASVSPWIIRSVQSFGIAHSLSRTSQRVAVAGATCVEHPLEPLGTVAEAHVRHPRRVAAVGTVCPRTLVSGH